MINQHGRRAQETSDAALVCAAQAGSERALDALFRRHMPRAKAQARRLVGDDAELEDVVQDSLLKALESLDQLRVPCAFSAWVGQIVTRRAGRLFKRRRVLRSREAQNQPGPALEMFADPGASPESALYARSVQSALGQLRTEHRRVLLLRRIERLPIVEVSARMHLSTSTVKRRLHAADRELRARLR